MNPARPQAVPTGTDRPALQSLYDVATAGEAGISANQVAGALLQRIASAAGAERGALVVPADGDRPARVAAAWSRAGGLLAANPGAMTPGDIASSAAASLPGAVALRITAHGRPVATVLLDDPADEGLAEQLCVPAGPVLDAALRADAASDRADRADRLASLTRDLMSIVSHELRTPLTSVIGSLQTLQRPEVDPACPDGRRLIASALGRAERLRTLLDDLAVTARSDTPVRARHRPADVGEVVRSAIASVPGAAALVAVDADPAVGPVVLDRSHLERVLVNLLDNAVRHGRGPVELAIRRTAGCLAITIVDHGPGVPPTIARAVLDRRHDSPDAALRPAGPGLGLTVTRSLVEGLGGTLRHETTPGGGATFTVEIPHRDTR